MMRPTGCDVCIVAKRCVLEQKLLLTVVYEELIGTKMNDLDLCIEVVYGTVNHCAIFAIGTVTDRGLVPKDNQ